MNGRGMPRPVPQNEDELAVAEERVHRLLSERNQLLRDKEHLNQVLNGILASKSWRLTQPLRAAVQTLRAIRNTCFPLLRRSTTNLDITVGRDISELPGSYEISGPGPYFILEPQEG